ncbi:exonuclease domain-containing protein [Antarcticirhabdus aurantiaca]|uniref:Exonuclease domain-containing protein n=1 Tax=Antarcticirhabdus aurantiaca TaxID=2606717 RepID=A0ACD4NU33_9HYPH|nr:exonuclease domain-containing protein [Antarcticirhabdus aurantiaca]WAJ30374.1 exonuclease domain-containing protein [Jeongeuplla avenae]
MDDVFPAARIDAAPDLFAPPVSGLVRVIDTETAGRPLAEDAVIEIGSVDLDLATGTIGNPMQTLVDPAGVGIDPRARRVHHISDEMLVGAPPFAEAVKPFLGAPAYAAQRASFDRSRLRFSGRWLCTWKLALRAFPDVRAHGLQSLVKYVPLDLSPVADLLETLHPHRALYDAACTAVLLRTIAERLEPRCDGLADFLGRAEQVSAEPALLAKLRFGRHKGVPLAQVPTDYLEWLVAEPGMDADARFTAERQLTRRAVRGQRSLPENAVLG